MDSIRQQVTSKRRNSLLFLPIFWLMGSALPCSAQAGQSSLQLIKRILPTRFGEFSTEILPAANRDTFEIESSNSKIVLRGNNGVSIASALYYYLSEYCHCQVTWNGSNLQLPRLLPPVAEKIRKRSPYIYRYYLNYCTFNYSMSWWTWERWEKEIDWMALHGINMPLAITGEEYTWYEVYRDMGFTDKELSSFFSGPSYFSWFWMGNLDGWGGPLPLNWMKSHRDLQQKVVKRERELGMKPVLAAFTGHVPAAFRQRFPRAKLKATNWKNGFADTYLLDAEDPLFASLGKRFLEKQTQLFGTDHLYSADTFNENEPPSDDPAFLSRLSARVYAGMREADTAGTWVMQGWLFYSDRKFWKEPQIKALLDAVPSAHMIILDLAAEIEPVWKKTEAFYGKPWIWNMLHNFGGNTNLFGRMEVVAAEPANALNDPASGKMQGIGLTMEGIEQNPVMYELMTAHTWTFNAINTNEWLKNYIRNRYGATSKAAEEAWNILRNTVYQVPANKYIRDGAESIIQARPTLDSFTRWTKTALNYKATDLLPAWGAMLAAVPECGGADGFRFDLVDVGRQVMANYAAVLHKKLVMACQQHHIIQFNEYSAAFLTLMDDLDRLLSTRKDFLLGPWLQSARAWGSTPAESDLFEMNARDLVTLWGDANNPLHEYACRQWSGLLSGFYKPRWQQYFSRLRQALVRGTTLDEAAFEKSIRAWEWKWVNAHDPYPLQPSGDPLVVSKNLYMKYRIAAADSN